MSQCEGRSDRRVLQELCVFDFVTCSVAFALESLKRQKSFNEKWVNWNWFA